MSKLILTKEEYQHIANSFDRLKQSYKRIKPEEWERGDKLLIKQICIKFSLQAPEDMNQFEVVLKRQHLRLLEAYCKASINRLENEILPAYIKRGDKQEYVQQTEELIKKVKGILIKLEALL